METTSDSAPSSTDGRDDSGSGSRDAAEQGLAVAERCLGALGLAGRSIRARRGMTTVSIGALVVAIGWLGERDSGWGVPLLLVGGLLIAIGLIGPRLSGSLGVRWGEGGTYLELSGVIAPPGERRAAPAAAPTGSPSELPARLIPPTEVEGSAETIEFNVEAIRAALGVEGAGSGRGRTPSSSA